MRGYLCRQYSPDWWSLRAGVPTASDFDRILSPTGKPSRQREKYIAELIAAKKDPTGNAFTERGRIGTPAMEAGRLCEPEARAFYAFHRGVKVQEVGIIIPEGDRFGCSPDGLVNAKAVNRGVGKDGQLFAEFEADGGLELKCPLQKTQEEYLRTPDTLPLKYKPQVHGQLIVTGLPWIDFVSYADGCDPVVVRVTPDAYTELLRENLSKFLAEYASAWERECVKAG